MRHCVILSFFTLFVAGKCLGTKGEYKNSNREHRNLQDDFFAAEAKDQTDATKEIVNNDSGKQWKLCMYEIKQMYNCFRSTKIES